jgi:NAD(P)-dependent dehydrogenase (short-subunit alcohol dehydrogenase family)
MAERDGGAIVNLTSRPASIGVPKTSLYSATKCALLALTRAAAVELAPRRIRVSAVAPGMTRTPLYDAWIADQTRPGSDRGDRARRNSTATACRAGGRGRG